MLISIIVPAYNEEKLLGPTLISIQQASQAFVEHGWNTELIVCDNNSTDNTAAIAKRHGAVVVFESENQIARARNRGAEAARGDWLLFIDADSSPSVDLFRDLLSAIESDRCIACGTVMQFDTADPAYRLAVWAWSCWSRLLRHMAGSFVAVEEAAFRAIGGFSLEFYAGEELDLSRRLQREAKQRSPRRHIKILTRHPLLTSGRKSQLYTRSEHARFLWRVFTRPFRMMRSRDACELWYDGRR